MYYVIKKKNHHPLVWYRLQHGLCKLENLWILYLKLIFILAINEIICESYNMESRQRIHKYLKERKWIMWYRFFWVLRRCYYRWPRPASVEAPDTHEATIITYCLIRIYYCFCSEVIYKLKRNCCILMINNVMNNVRYEQISFTPANYTKVCVLISFLFNNVMKLSL